MTIVPCLRLSDELDALLMDFVRRSEDRLRQSIQTVPKAGQSADELAEVLNLNWSAFASKQFPKEVQAKEIPSLFINAPKSTKKESGTVVYALRHPAKVDEFQKYQAEMQAQWRTFFNKQGAEVDEDAFFCLSGMEGLKPSAGTLTATSAPEQALLSVVEEITERTKNAPKGAEMSALPNFSTDPAVDMLLSKYVAEIYGNFASYLSKKYGDAGIEGIDAIISLLEQARGEYLSRTLSHLTGFQSAQPRIVNPSQITVAQVKDFLSGQGSLPRSEIEALAGRLSEHFGEARGLSSPDVSFLQVYLSDVIASPPNAMRGIGRAEGLNHIRFAIHRAYRIGRSTPNYKEKVSAIMEDLFNKRIPADTPEPLRRWLQQHGWAEAKPSAPKVESAVEEAVPTARAVEEPTPAPEPAPVLRAEDFPSVEQWTPQRANSAIESVNDILRKARKTKPPNQTVNLLKSLFGDTTISANPSGHFRELLQKLKRADLSFTEPFYSVMKQEIAKIQPEIREAVADWLQSLRRFGEEMAGKDGITAEESAEFVGYVDRFISVLSEGRPRSALVPEPPPAPATAMKEAEQAWEQALPTTTPTVQDYPLPARWEPQRANRAMVELEQVLSNVPQNRATSVLKKVFATTTTASSPTEHFQELLRGLRTSERVLSQAFFKEELASLPPAVREAVSNWLLSLRRFGEEMVGRGVSAEDSAEFVRIIDGYLSALREAEPPARTSAVDEAIEQMAEPAPAPVARAEEPAPAPAEPAPAEPAPVAETPARRRRGKRAEEPTPEQAPPAEAPPAEPPAPPTVPPPTAGGEPIELPQGIEFEEFPNTLHALLKEYGLPPIRSGKKEYEKMEQLIYHYFGTNGSFSSIREEVLTALNEMLSVGNANTFSGIKNNTRLLDIQDGRVVLRRNFEQRLGNTIAELRRAEPVLHFVDDDHLAGFILLEDALNALAISAGEEAYQGLAYIRHYLSFRLLNPKRLEDLPDIISALAGGLKQADAQTARGAVEDIETFLRQRVGEEWFQEVEDRLKDILATGVISRLIYAYFRKAPVLYYGDGRLTEAEWSAWDIFAKRQFVKTLLTDEQAWGYFRANFANPVEIDRLREGIQATPVVRHPYILHALLTYAQEAGLNLPALVATADVFRRHIDAVRDIFFKSGIPPSTLASIDDFGVNGYRAWLTELRTALQRQGAEDADRVLEQALEAVKDVDDDLLGFEVLKAILGFSNDLDGLPALKQAMNNLANVMFALHGFYKKAVVANIGEELLPVLRAFQDEGLIGEVIVPEPTVFSGRSLRKALKEEYGAIDADTAFRYLVDGLPPSVRSIYYTAQTAGREAEFDLFIPSFVADLIAQPDFLRTRQVWDTLNNIFKSSVIVYNPPALIRNAFTNTLLMWYVGGENIFRRAVRQVQPYGEIPRPLEVGIAEAFKLQREAVREIKAGSKLARDLEAIDPSLSLLRTYERLPEWEIINSTDSRAVRGFRWVSNRPLLRSAHYFQTMSETAAKYASVKELLRRWGKLENYTTEDLIRAVAETNAWLINYRVVPPAVQFMRKYLGLFPFITFQLNTLVNFARHPERFYTDLLRGGVYMERLHNIFYFLANDPLTTQHDIRGEQKTLFKLFPEYMRHNPLLVAVPDDRGDVWAMDLTYWLPIGVFETQYDPHPIFGEMPIPLPQLATIGWMTDYKDLVRYFGGALRPFAEAILNKNLLTGQPIYDEELPELEKARAIGGYLIGQVPFLRWLLGMGFGAREVNPIGRTRSADTLLQRGVSLMGIRAYHIDALQEARIKELQAKMNDINQTLRSLANNPSLTPARRAELARMYQEKLYDLQQQLDEQYLVWVPLVVRLDGKTPTYINTPADFQALVSNLQARRRIETREQFFNEAYPPPVPPALPPFTEEIDLGEMSLAGAVAGEED
jgi:hypothetical protein